jgi:signal peptidase I
MDEQPNTPITSLPAPKPGRLRSGLVNLGIILVAPLVAIFLTLFVFQSYQVDGVSMENTLQNNDRLIVWKLPRTWTRITGHQYVPKRGDIVIVNQQNLTACGQDGKQIVKRVIGLPGDHVVYKNGAYTVYNATNPTGFDPDKTLPYGLANTALLQDDSSPNANVTLSKSQVFVSGDHRADSCDSRYFGAVDTSSIVGKVAERIFPLGAMKKF